MTDKRRTCTNFSVLFALVALHVLVLPRSVTAVGDSPGSVPLIALLEKETDWYNSEEARVAATSVISYQSNTGAWPKNHDLLQNITQVHVRESEENTIDNLATTLPMKFLARMAHATSEEQYKDSFLRGLDYLLEAQYANGGWPQHYPLQTKKTLYRNHITFNDNAMINVMNLLHAVAHERVPYTFIDRDHLNKVSDAVALGVNCILATQIQQNGTLAGWAAQYNELTLEPAGARAYELPSLSGGETAPIVEFLIKLSRPTAEVIAAVEGATAWLEKVAIKGFKYRYSYIDQSGKKDSDLVANPDAPWLWARYYELGTNRPIFAGRDGVVRYSMEEIEQERRGGYHWYGMWAQTLLNKKFPRWKYAQCKRKCYREDKCNSHATIDGMSACKRACKSDCRAARK